VYKLIFPAALGLAAIDTAAAQNAAVAQGHSTIDLAVAEKDLADPRKFFIFHKSGVSVQEAEADLAFCSRFLANGAQRTLPAFVPWGNRPAPQENAAASTQYGLMGAAIGAVIDGPLLRSRGQARLFRCMAPRGYSRYRTSQAIWQQLNLGDPVQSVKLRAQVASGPVPPTPQVLP
jgi:hypothetical protein